MIKAAGTLLPEDVDDLAGDGEHDTASVIEILGANGIIVHRTIPIPKGGGITVLKGRCGSGKTTALDGISTLLGNRSPALSANDTLGKGYVRGFGTEVKIGKQVRRAGVPLEELEVRHIEDRFDLAQIVDPGFDKPEANDAARLRAIVQNSGVVIDAKEFLELAAGHDVDLSEVSDASDPVEMASKFKRAVQAAALAIEKEAKPIQERSDACAIACEGIDILAPCGAVELEAAYSEAVSRREKLKERKISAEKSAVARTRAQARIAELNAAFTGLPLVLAEQEHAARQQEFDEANAAVIAAEKLRAEAKEALRLAVVARDRAQDHESSLEAMNEILDGADLEGAAPTDDEIQAAIQAASDASARMSSGETVRRAKAKNAEMLELARKAKSLTTKAEALRVIAARGDEVLSRAITVPNIRFFGGRLLYGENGHEELFERRSTGQKWTTAFETAAIGLSELTGDGTRLCILRQEAWQALDPDLRRHVWELAKAKRINVATGEVSGGPLRAEIFDPDAE